jgi:enamine deaminase RidA (YjgF/YER057c/UK114 family)
MGMNVETRLRELGYTLPPAVAPIAAYVPAVRVGNLLFVSGQLPMRDGKLSCAGPVPSVVSVDFAKQAAAQSALNGLAAAGNLLAGDWTRIVRVVRLGVFVLSDAGFTAHAQVANGASELMEKIFGDSGRHVRAAVGASALPLGASVEVEMVFEVA